jgi:hypothetical protein
VRGGHGGSLEIIIGVSRDPCGDFHVIDIYPIVLSAGIRLESEPDEEIRYVVMSGEVYMDFTEGTVGGSKEPAIIEPGPVLA